MDREELVAVALGERAADLMITGGQLVDVHTGEIYPADIAIAGTRIAAVGDVSHCVGEATRRVEAGGRYLVPGLIDCHIHVGATSLGMTEFARLVVPYGTAAIVTDFTEAGKMRGKMAMRFFLDETARTPLRAYFSPFYTTLLGIGAYRSTTLAEMEEMLGWPECVELREWNVYAQRHPSEEVRRLGELARQKRLLLCGHMETQHGRTLQASVAAGALSDHETATAEEALARARLGLAVLVRFSSAGDDMTYVLEAITRYKCDTRQFMFSSDEEDIDDIARLGHIDHRVRAAIGMGVAPVEAVRMGSLNAASYLRVTDELGSLTPGRIGFVNLVNDLRDFRVSTVVYGGAIVAESSRYVGDLPHPEYPASFYNTVRLKAPLRSEDFAIPAPNTQSMVDVRVIGTKPRVVTTEERRVALVVRDGRIVADPERDVAKIAVVERHEARGEIGTGFVQGFGLRRGAFGSSYHPGPLNIAVVGMNDADMALVANRIAALQGGFVAALDGEILAEVHLPLLGFLSEAPAEEVVAGFRRVKEAIHQALGSRYPGLYTTLAYLCMPGVAPVLRMSANGLMRIELGESEITVSRVAVPVASTV